MMSLRDNKMAILRELGLTSEPTSLPELLHRLGPEFKERSVRRWLTLLIQEGSVKKTGSRRGTKYFAAERSTKISYEIHSCFSSASLKAIELIKKPLFERQPVAYADDWFESYVPNSSYYLNESLRRQLLNSGKRASKQDPAATYAHQIFNRLLIDLSYNSSRLEGNTYSLIDTERLLLHGDTAEGKLDEEKVMILNHKEAIRYLVENASRDSITRNTICTLHYLLADGLVEPFEAGKVRKHGVRIGGSTYIPFEEPKKLESQLEKIILKAGEIQDPFEQSLFLLIHISYLHAFIDVNKRTARLTANIPLVRENLVPLAFSDIPIEDYMLAMIAIYEFQDSRPIVDLYVHSYLRTCLAYDSTVKAIGFDEIRVRYRQPRKALLRNIILQEIKGAKLQKYLEKEAINLVPTNVLQEFIEDLLQDLAEIDESRIAGLGVTPEQLKFWQDLK